jgi:hypothetical protein
LIFSAGINCFFQPQPNTRSQKTARLQNDLYRYLFFSKQQLKRVTGELLMCFIFNKSNTCAIGELVSKNTLTIYNHI